MVKKNSIPERWRSLKAVGQRVPGSRFIAFKVPLKGATSQRVTQNQKFTPKDLLTAIRNQNEELGLIIDLTNTERYYTTKDLPKSVQYVKLHTAGLKIPDDATIHQFKRVVRRFLFAHEDDDKIIGVHCTTGINRTGYLICRYLIDIEGWRPLHSISAFAQARGHPIEGAVYIEDLIKGAPRSNVGIDTPPTDEERRALESTEEFPWERGQRSILEPSNEFGDFDARGGGGRPGEDFHDPRGGRNILGDHDLRLPREPQQGRGYMDDRPRPMHPSERFGRPDMEGRFNPEMQNRRDFHGPGPRPLMNNMQGGYGPRPMQRPYEGAGMGQEDMDYDMRGRGRPNAPHSHEEFDNAYSHPVPPYARNKMGNPMYNEEEEEAEEYPYEEYEEEGQGYDPNEEMGNSYQGPPNERMNPNARPMQGMNKRMGPRDPHFMGAPQNKRFPGPMNERMAPRNARPMGPPGGGANAREGTYMEGPGNSQYADESMNDFSSGEVPMTKRMHPNAGRRMGMPMNEGVSQGHMPQRSAQGVNKPMYGSRGMDDSMNDQGYQGYSQTYNEPVTYPRNPKSFDGSQSYQGNSQGMDMNNRMPQHAVDGAMNKPMYSRDPQGIDGQMNEWGSMEGMHPRGNKFGMNKPRPADGPARQNFSGDARNFEGRNAPEGPNRYTPYPPRKPMQAPQTMGAPGGDQYNMTYPTHSYEGGYPPRNRMN